MRILVAGALGEVGRTVSAALSDRGHEVVGASSRAPVAGSRAIGLGEAADRIAAGSVDLVVNAAGRGDRRPGDRPGTDATTALAPAIAATAVPGVLLSTMRVLEGHSQVVAEDAPARATTPYAEANALSEELWLGSCGPSGCVLRIANYFCAPSAADSPQALLLPWSLVTEALATGSITVRSGPLTTREFVSADDVAQALVMLAADQPASRVCATVPGWHATLADLVGATGDAFVTAGLSRPSATFGSEDQVTPPSAPGWLSRHGWSSGLDQPGVSGVIAQWLVKVALD